jgi:pseudaminic acid synthase
MVDYSRTGAEKDSAVFRRSLYVVENIRAGEILTTSNIRSIRPGFGLAPKHLPKVLGRRAVRDLPRGHALAWCDLNHR